MSVNLSNYSRVKQLVNDPNYGDCVILQNKTTHETLAECVKYFSSHVQLSVFL